MSHLTCSVLLGLLALMGCLSSFASQAEVEPPNILIILADDLGMECLASYGGQSHETPNLDRLAEQGMRFTHCFSNPTCSPSRASLLTGRYSFRHGVERVIWHNVDHAELYLRTDQPSFARQLKAAGYRTAIAGKWQLSFLHQRDTIRDFGFDQYQCWQIYDEAENKTRRFHRPHFNENGKIRSEEIAHRYGPEVNVEFLAKFIKASSKQGRPFLAYYTCLLPHYPWVPTPDSEDQDYELTDTTGKGDPKYFPDMVRYMDKNIGQLLKSLDEAGVADNTVVIFLADNGTDQELIHLWQGHEVPGGKGTMTDRGTRVPLIVRWPGRVQPGSVCEDLIDFSDLYPTLCELAKADKGNQPIHGQSFLPQLLGQLGSPRAWVHYQDKAARVLRTKECALTNRGEFREVTKLHLAPAEPLDDLSPAQAHIRESLRAAFEQLGN